MNGSGGGIHDINSTGMKLNVIDCLAEKKLHKSMLSILFRDDRTEGLCQQIFRIVANDDRRNNLIPHFAQKPKMIFILEKFF